MSFEDIKESLSFDDVLLVPQYSEIQTRKSIDISSALDSSQDRILKIPIISSPMDTVSEDKMVCALHSWGGLSIIHRYNTIEEQYGIISRARDLINKAGTNEKVILAAAVGVGEDLDERSDALVEGGACVLCIDVAHGHHVLVKKAINLIRNKFGDQVHIMAGNIATSQAYWDLSEWGADSVRVGIGSGACCSTRISTGHGVPLLRSLIDLTQTRKSFIGSAKLAKIIADGGMRNAGDIVKAIAFGADFVMCGSLLAGTDEAPGEILVDGQGNKRKVYRGQASKESQIDWRGWASAPEGVNTTIPYKGSVIQILKDLVGNIQSGFSYSGAKNIEEFRTKVKVLRQTQAGYQEGLPHILNSK